MKTSYSFDQTPKLSANKLFELAISRRIGAIISIIIILPIIISFCSYKSNIFFIHHNFSIFLIALILLGILFIYISVRFGEIISLAAGLDDPSLLAYIIYFSKVDITCKVAYSSINRINGFYRFSPAYANEMFSKMKKYEYATFMGLISGPYLYVPFFILMGFIWSIIYFLPKILFLKILIYCVLGLFIGFIFSAVFGAIFGLLINIITKIFNK